MLDDGATVTLIDSKIAKQIGAKGTNSILRLQAVKGTEIFDSKSQKINFDIMNPMDEQKNVYKIRDAQTIENLSLPPQSLHAEDIKSYKHLRDLDINYYYFVRPKILIGQDNSHLITPKEIRITSVHEPVGLLTQLGWAIHGNVKHRHPKENKGHIGQLTLKKLNGYNEEETGNDLHRIVKLNFSLESIGIKLTCRKDKDSERVENILRDTTRRVGNKWEASLLWKSDCIKMPNSKEYAKKRLEAVERKMDRDADYGKQYTREIENLIRSKYAKRIGDSYKTSDCTWYLPHFGIKNQNKPGKFRLVFDAAAKVDGVSLNDQLMSGPDLVTPLLSVLIKFRIEKIAFKGDIKEMFLQVKIRNED